MTIKEYLKTHGINMRQLADKANISVSAISRYLSSETRYLSHETRAKLSKLGIEEPCVKVKKKRIKYRSWQRNAPQNSVARYLIDHEMKIVELSKITGVSPAILTQHLNGKSNLSAKNRQKLCTLGITNFDIKPSSSKTKNETNDDETMVTEIIRYIIEQKEGVVYVFNHNQILSLVEWLKSRGYKFEYVETDKNDYEIYFKKVEKEEGK